MSKTFIVLGMHRSATSLVAKSLSHEICMGMEFIPANEHNEEGFYEDKRFLSLNDRILGTAGGSWNNPPTEKNISSMFMTFKAEIKELVENMNKKHDLWGWKDPRTVLTIRLFVPFIQNPHFIRRFVKKRE